MPHPAARPRAVSRLPLLILILLVLPAGASPALSAAEPLPAPMPGLAPEDLFPGAEFNPSVPPPRSVLGVPLGGRPLRHGEILHYFEVLAGASQRATLTTYGRTHEGRELLLLAVSDEPTIRGLDAFREEHARLVDPRGRGPGEDAALLEDAKAVAWMAYAIHGDELSSGDAAVALAYWLVAGEDEAARALRRDLVVLIDPCQNPD
ncbi:MAG: zinc carboxypeptidase, partial [Candidatus Rokubacteria bacterium]|nr:zinc carboxypeptidase [Candidatus Rokubacteria bacterium]